MYRTDFWTLWEKARVGCFKRTASKHVYYLGWNRSPAQVGCMRQVLRPGALGRPRGIGWRGRWEGGAGWGTHVNPWLIHFNVWQKLLQCCKVISLQLIKINKLKKKKKLRSEIWRCYNAGSEDGERGYEPRNASCLWKLRRQRKEVSSRISRKNTVPLTHFRLLTSRPLREEICAFLSDQVCDNVLQQQEEPTTLCISYKAGHTSHKALTAEERRRTNPLLHHAIVRNHFTAGL